MRLWLLLGTAVACTQTGQFDEVAFTSSLYAGSLGGILLGCLLVVLASLPLCFGRLKEHRQAISALTISLGLVTLLVPLFGSLSACGPFVQSVCRDRCSGYECTKKEEEGLAQVCHALGFLVVYIGSYGWVACVVGILAASLGCCVCCRCCRPMRKERLEPEPLELSELPVRSTKLSPAVPVLVMGTPSPKQAERAPVAPPPTPELPDCALRSAKLSPAVPVLVMGTPSPKQADAAPVAPPPTPELPQLPVRCTKLSPVVPVLVMGTPSPKQADTVPPPELPVLPERAHRSSVSAPAAVPVLVMGTPSPKQA